MEPGREDHAAGARRHILYSFCEIVIETGVYRFLALGHILLLKVNADLIQGQVVFYPLQAFACRLHLRKVVVAPGLGAHNGGDHSRHIHQLPGRHGGYPTGGAAVDVGAAHGSGSGTYADEGSVAAAAKHRRAGRKAQFTGSLLRQAADALGGLCQPGQVVGVHAKHPAESIAPALLAFPGIIEEGGIGAVPGHHCLTGTPEDQVLLYIQPLPHSAKVVWFIFLHPFILPQGILDAAGHCSGKPQTGQQFSYIGPGDLNAVSQAFAQLGTGPLVHVAHRAADRPAAFVHQDQALHLGAEGNGGNLLGPYGAGGEKGFGGGAHGLPPLVRVLLRTAVWQNVQLIPLLGACHQLDGGVYGKETGLYPCGADVVS